MRRRTASTLVLVLAIFALFSLTGRSSWAAPQGGQLQDAVTADTPAPAALPPRPERVRFAGIIGALPASPGRLVGDWEVGGVWFRVTEQTVVVPSEGSPREGDWARVTATRTPEGQIAAEHILWERSSHAGAHPVEFKGLIEVVGVSRLMVSGIDVQMDSQTRLTGTPVIGYVAVVRGFLVSEYSVMASKIEVIDPAEQGTEFEGEIREMPDFPYYGVWLVGEVPVAVDASTQLSGLAPAVGLFAEVTGFINKAGHAHARAIRVVNPLETTVAGTVDEIGQGWWLISGQTVAVDQSTFIDESRCRAKVGMRAEATVKHQAGVMLAIRIRLERPW